MKTIIYLFVLLFLGQELSAQEKVKFRVGLNSIHGACHYGFTGPNTSPLYQFSKTPLTNFDEPVFSYQKGSGLSFNRTITYNFSVEKRVSRLNLLSLGVVLNDMIDMGTSITLASNGIDFNYAPSYSHRLNETSGSYSRRFTFAFAHQLDNLSAIKPNKKRSLLTEISLGTNFVQYSNSSDNSTSTTTTTTSAGDTLRVESSYQKYRGWGITLAGGVNVKLYNNDKKREIVCLSVNYEQGLISRGDIVVMQNDIYFTNGPKQLHFSETVFSRGSRLNVTLSRSFNLPNFKKKKETHKVNTQVEI
jgi:hypothetical protein